MENVVIRSSIESDLPVIVEIYNDALINTTAIYMEEPFEFEERKKWFHKKQEEGWPMFTAMVGERIAGFSTYGPFHERWGYRYTVEQSIYVHHDFRGMGIGKLLVQKLIDTARQERRHALIASVDSEITASINLHLSMGYKEVGRFEEIGFKFARWLSVRCFELKL